MLLLFVSRRFSTVELFLPLHLQHALEFVLCSLPTSLDSRTPATFKFIVVDPRQIGIEFGALFINPEREFSAAEFQTIECQVFASSGLYARGRRLDYRHRHLAGQSVSGQL